MSARTAECERGDWKGQIRSFPTTRYQGSKRRLLPWLGEELSGLDFDTALDLFSGTASVSYLLKALGKEVTSNDQLSFNREIAEALVVNEEARLAPEGLLDLGTVVADRSYERLIEREFEGVFYLGEENRWLDTAIQNLHGDFSGFERSLGLYALFQACLSKRPYNLFHRANLSMRTADVERSFGNKKTWERSFEDHCSKHLSGANAAVFFSGRSHRAVSHDFRAVDGDFDLVYMDPPYTPERGRGVDYLDFYHFLEGLMNYLDWGERIDRSKKHLPWTAKEPNPWCDVDLVRGAFEEAFDRYRHSTLVVSYRDDGQPSISDIVSTLRAAGRPEPRVRSRPYQYALSRKSSQEVLIISEP